MESEKVFICVKSLFFLVFLVCFLFNVLEQIQTYLAGFQAETTYKLKHPSAVLPSGM